MELESEQCIGDYGRGAVLKILCEAHATAAQGKSVKNKELALDILRRLGHISVPALKADCLECALTKGRKSSHKAVGPNKYVTARPFGRLAADFLGHTQPIFIAKDNFILVTICDISSYVYVKSIRHKDQVYEELPHVIKDVRRRGARYLGEKIVRWVLDI